MAYDMVSLLRMLVDREGSDLHITVGFRRRRVCTARLFTLATSRAVRRTRSG